MLTSKINSPERILAKALSFEKKGLSVPKKWFYLFGVKRPFSLEKGLFSNRCQWIQSPLSLTIV